MVSLPHRSRNFRPTFFSFVVLATSELSLLVLVWSVSAVHMAVAQSPPTASYAQPSAIDPRTTSRVTIHGDQFVAPIRVLCSAPVKSSVVEVTAKKVVIDITPESELPLGPNGLWIATTSGITSPLSLLVDPLPTVAEATDNHSPLSAQSIGTGSAIDGTADGKQLDYFRFHADQDQEITFEVLAQHIGSACDPVVRILREENSRLVRSIDDDATSVDCRFRHRFASAGNYLLEIHDNRYRAGARYRLRMGQLPLVTFAYPPVVQRGTCARVYFAGPDSSSLAACELTVPDDQGLAAINVTAIDKRSGAATWSAVSLTDSIQMSEAEPNDDPSKANVLDSTSAANGLGFSGLFEKAGDRDCFRFSAHKDQSFHFVARTRSFGSATVLKMKVLGNDGQVLARSPVGDADEPQFDFKAPGDGEYVLEVADLVDRGGPEHGYHVALETQPSFQLQLKPDAATRDNWAIQPTAGAGTLAVVVQRQGYDGAIDLRLSPALAGLTLHPSTIPAGSKEALLLLRSSAEFDPQCLTRLRIIGTAATPVPDKKIAPTLLGATALSIQRAPHQPFPLAWQTSGVSIVGVADAPPLFTWAEVPTPAEGSKPTSAADVITTNPMKVIRSSPNGVITLNLKRNLKEFKGPVTLISSELPTGWNASPKFDKDVLTLTVKHPKEKSEKQTATSADAELLKFRFFAEHSGRGQIIETVVPVRMVTPLSISPLTLQAMTAGEKQNIMVEIVREAVPAAPVQIRVQNLPKGVTAPDVAEIAADQTKIELVLTAAADAEATEAKNVIFMATTKNGDQEIVTTSSPATLVIQRP